MSTTRHLVYYYHFVITLLRNKMHALLLIHVILPFFLQKCVGFAAINLIIKAQCHQNWFKNSRNQSCCLLRYYTRLFSRKFLVGILIEGQIIRFPDTYQLIYSPRLKLKNRFRRIGPRMQLLEVPWMSLEIKALWQKKASGCFNSSHRARK